MGPLSRSNARWLYIAPSLLLFWIIGNIDKLSISVIVTNHPFLQAMGMVGRPVEIGLLATAFTFAYGVCAFCWGFVVDRIGPRQTAMIGVSIWTLMMLLGGLSVSYGMLLTSRIILGIGESVLWAVSNRFVGNWFHREEKAKAIAAFAIGPNLGPAIGVPLVVAILASGGWRWAFFVQAALSLLICLPMFTWLTRDLPEQHPAANQAERHYLQSGRSAAPVRGGEATAEFRRLVASPLYWLDVVNIVVSGMVFYGLGIWLPTYLEHARHFAPAQMAVWTSVTWLVAMGAVAASGIVADKLLRPALICLVEYLICGGALAVVAGTANASLAAAMLAIGVGFGAGGFFELGQAILHRLGSPQALGRAAGIMGGLGTIIGGFTPTIIGFLVALSHGSFVGSILLMEVVIAVGFVCVGIIALHEARTFRPVAQTLTPGRGAL